MLIYLADLRHDTLALTPDTMPLGIGFLAAYGTKVLGPEVEFKLFAYPSQMLEALRHTKPDVLGVTNYCWSYALHSRMLRYARGLYPNLLTVMGGPNMPLDQEGRDQRLRETAALDICVIDEGEQAFADLLRRYLDASMIKSKLFTEPLPSSIFVDPNSGHVIRGTPTTRTRELDEVPSPYLTGLMDPFFDGVLCPMIQTNRGCPFTCTFCVEGVGYMTKVNKFSVERVQEELDYIGHRVGAENALMITDSNFGMLPGDMETTRSIREQQQRIGWPKFVWATTGKNNKEAILSAIDVLGGSMKMTNAVQSMDPGVLANIKRSNIKLETYAALQREVTERKRQSYAEVIVGLPGETKESFLQGICQLLDSGVQEVSCYQLMLLDGTELNHHTVREKFGFQTRFRIQPQSFGLYDGEPVIELEEIVVGTNTLSFQDYMECRKLQLILQVFHREGLFGELLGYLSSRSVLISAFIMDLLSHLDSAPKMVEELFEQYLSEARDELFTSKEEALRLLEPQYDALVSRELGGNLQQKYSSLALFESLGPVVQYGIQRAKELVLKEPGLDPDTAVQVDEELEAIGKYLMATVINIGDVVHRFEELVVPLEYDIETWKAEGYSQPLSDFKYTLVFGDDGLGRSTRDAVFYVPESQAAYLEGKLRIYGTSTSALGKVLYRVVLRDLRRQVRLPK